MGDSPAVDVTVVLPCAGQGQRFGAPYPKELHRYTADRSLIDLALAPVVDLGRHGQRVRLVVTLNPGKLATARYLAPYADHLDLVFTFQCARHGHELAGALRAAAPLCAGAVMLILPDQHFTWSTRANPLRQALAHLDDAEWVVLAAPTTDPEILRTEGAVRVDLGAGPSRVVAAADKPAEPGPYNAVWAAVACRDGQAGRLADLVTAAGSSPVCGAPAVLVDGYRNVGYPEQAGDQPPYPPPR